MNHENLPTINYLTIMQRGVKPIFKNLLKFETKFEQISRYELGVQEGTFHVGKRRLKISRYCSCKVYPLASGAFL
jgi:hypothetical protein